MVGDKEVKCELGLDFFFNVKKRIWASATRNHKQKNVGETGFWKKVGLGNGIYTPPPKGELKTILSKGTKLTSLYYETKVFPLYL